MAVRGMGMPRTAYQAPPQPQYYGMQKRPDKENDPFMVTYNQCFYGPLELDVTGCTTELKFHYNEKQNGGIMVSFSCNTRYGIHEIGLPLRKLQSITYSPNGVALHLLPTSRSSTSKIDDLLNHDNSIESMLKTIKRADTEDFAKRQLIFVVDQAGPSISKNLCPHQARNQGIYCDRCHADLNRFHEFSQWLVRPEKASLQKRRGSMKEKASHHDICSKFIERISPATWTEYLSQLCLGEDQSMPSRVVYLYDRVRNYPSAPVAYKQIKDEYQYSFKPKRNYAGALMSGIPSKLSNGSSSSANGDSPSFHQNGENSASRSRGGYNLLEDPSTISLHETTTKSSISCESVPMETDAPSAPSASLPTLSEPSEILLPGAPDKLDTVHAPTQLLSAIELIDDEEEQKCTRSGESQLARFTPAGAKNRDSITVTFEDARVLAFNEMLNDSVIEFYLKYSKDHSRNSPSSSKVHIFNSFFYQKLNDNMKGDYTAKTLRGANNRFKSVSSNYPKVKNWTRSADIFSKDIIVVPINTDVHWYVVVIMNPSAAIAEQIQAPEEMESSRKVKEAMNEPKATHIIVLDSMPDPSDPRRFVTADILCDYLELEVMDKRKCQLDRSKIGKLMLRNVPRQSNFIDCGLYLLAFAEAIFRNPPSLEVLNKPGLDFRDLCRDFEITPLQHMRDKIVAVLQRHAGRTNWKDLKHYEKSKGKGVTVDTEEALVDRGRRPRRHSGSCYPLVSKAPGFITRWTSEPPDCRIPDSIVLRPE